MSPSDFDQERAAEEHHGPTIRDKRVIDPETYELREPQAAAAPPPKAEPVDSEVAILKRAVDERTADLQRLQAEYVNYKRRVDRDRDLARKVTIENVVKDLLPVLDDVRSAREHGELTGGFKAVGDELERITTKYGLTSFGEAGEAFDPHIHEALLHAHADGIDGPTCVEILQPGYRIGDRILRPARVAVAEPDPDAPAPAGDAQPGGEAAPAQGDSAASDSASGESAGGASGRGDSDVGGGAAGGSRPSDSNH